MDRTKEIRDLAYKNMSEASAELRGHQFGDETWSKYRMRTEQTWSFDRFPDTPKWENQDLSDKIILLWYEQGVGEQLLFAQYAQRLASEAKRVIYECDSRIVSLLQRSMPEVDVIPYTVPWDERVYDVDYQCPAGDVLTYRIHSWKDFPFSKGFLKPDPDLVDHFQNKYVKYPDLVGLNWSSSAQFWSSSKSIPLHLFNRLGKDRPILNLQYGKHASPYIADDEVNIFQDFEHVAALVLACDEIVNISNATAHVVGGVGKHNYVLLPNGVGRHWYWFPECRPHPFYFNTEILIQTVPLFWDNIVSQVTNKILDKS